MYADLHIHTYYSDGIHSPKEIFEFAKEHGVHTIAITDHDTTDHLDQCENIAREYGINLIRGVELSCYNYETKKKVHILGLGLNRNPAEVDKLGKKVLEGRNSFHRKMIEELSRDGYKIDFSDALRHSKTDTVFKMHLFLAIKEKYPEVDQKFYNKYFLKKDTTNVDLEMNYIDVKEGIEAILNDGGIPVLAHPNLYDSFPEVEAYVSYGLLGIEKSHFTMNEKDINLAIKLAEKHNLLLSGGSDFHANNDGYNNDIGQYGLTKKEYIEIEKLIIGHEI